MSDQFNMTMRKFLKQVGVTSQQAIEEALRDHNGNDQEFSATAVITIEKLGLTHEVTGIISNTNKSSE